MTGPDLIVWLLGTLAAYRLWQLLAHDDLPVLAEARDRLVGWLDARHLDRYADAIVCPWCLGFWCCVATFAGIYAADPYPMPVLHVAAASTVVGLTGARTDG